MRSGWVVILVLLLTGCGRQERPPGLSISEALEVDTTGFARAKPGYAMQFPADHGPHPDFYLEWWYFTGNLETASGNPVGYQFAIFRNALAPPYGPDENSPNAEPGTSEWSTRQLYSAHLAVSLPARERFISHERFARGAAGLSGARADSSGVEVWVETLRMEAAPDLSEIRLLGQGPDAGMDLTLRPSKPIVLQGEDGYSPKGRELGQASHYYSITRLATAGTIRVSGDSLRVSGNSWLDREWSTSLLARDQSGWDWFSLQLDGGRDLMYFRLRSGGDSDFVDGTLVAPDGSREPFDPEQVRLEVREEWTSPASGVRYPVAWRLSAPDLGLDLTITAAMNAQELATSVRYWEGSVLVSGSDPGGAVSGRGYVELTGYEAPE